MQPEEQQDRPTESRPSTDPSPSRICLSVSGGPDQGNAIESNPNEVIRVGRSHEVEMSVADPALSRTHFELRWTLKGWMLNDLGSHNGTFVGDRQVDSCLLADKDSIRAGDTMFLVSLFA